MDIKVYVADVGQLMDEKLFQHLYKCVSAGRREKVDRMRLDKDKRLSLGAGALLESALAAEGVEDCTMVSTQNAKPCLAHRNDIHFNISHSGTKVMCAISDCDIGCDVEQITNIDMEIARRFFFSEEYEALMKCRDIDTRNKLFFRYWTLKESFMKATGLGFTLPLNQFCVILGGSKASVKQNVDNRSYCFREFELDDGYKYAICSVDKPVERTRIETIVL